MNTEIIGSQSGRVAATSKASSAIRYVVTILYSVTGSVRNVIKNKTD